MTCTGSIVDGVFTCDRCKRRIKVRAGAVPLATCKGDACPHLGSPLGRDESAPCSSCGSKDGRKLFSVWECSLFGECLPFYRPTAAERALYVGRPWICEGCPHRE